jgi:hypothetical protein
MTDWYSPKHKLPKNNEDCLLLGGDHNDSVVGPIMWKTSLATAANPDAPAGCWLDLWATPEAGTAITTDQVLLWTPWDAVKPPDEQIAALERDDPNPDKKE